EALDDDAVVHRGVHHADFVDAQLGDLFDNRLGKRLESAGDHNTLVIIDRVLDEDFVLDVFKFFRLFDAQLFNVVKQLENVGIGAVTEGAEEGGGQKLAAALFAVQIDVKQVAGVEL